MVKPPVETKEEKAANYYASLKGAALKKIVREMKAMIETIDELEEIGDLDPKAAKTLRDYNVAILDVISPRKGN